MADGERVCTVEVSGAVVLPPIQVVGENSTRLGVGHSLSIGVGDKKIQAMAGTFLDFDLQGVVAGIIAVASLVEALYETELLKINSTRIEILAVLGRQTGKTTPWLTERNGCASSFSVSQK